VLAELAFALDLADRADVISMGIFQGDVRVSIKADTTPVTQADTEVEAMVRARVAEVFPGDRVLGEEEGGDALGPGRVWIVDPIDATKNFARGIPVFSTLIALQIDGEPVLGVASAPAIGERYEAVRGGGARFNGAPMRVSDRTTVAASQIFFAGLDVWFSPGFEGVAGVLLEAERTRGFGDFWGHLLVARGAGELCMEPELRIWDYAALKVIVEEAGGRMTTLGGEPVHDRSSVMSTNGFLHEELVRRFGVA
jgi:histidinol-phosphatase